MNPAEFAKKYLEIYEAAQNYYKIPVRAIARERKYWFVSIVSMTSDGIVAKVLHYEGCYEEDLSEVTELDTISFETLGIRF